MEVEKIYQTKEVSVSILSTHYTCSYSEKDYNPVPSMSFPLCSAFQYKSGKRSFTITSNDVLIERDGIEYEVSKFKSFNADHTLVVQFLTSSLPLLPDKCAFKVVKRTPELEFHLRNFLVNGVPHLERDEFIQHIASHLAAGNKQRSSFKHLQFVRTEQAKDYIFANSHEDISVNDIAQTCNISPFHFSRLFKLTTGYSPYEFLLKIRVEKARKLLKKGNLVSDVAFEVGFSSLANFSYSFHRATGHSPQAYKRARFRK